MLKRLVYTAVLVLLILSPTIASAGTQRDDAPPGIPIGDGTRTGVVEYGVDEDWFCTYLTEGQKVRFSGWGSSKQHSASLWLYRDPRDTDDALVYAGYWEDPLEYTPAVSGIYYVRVFLGATNHPDGVYELTVTGSDHPGNATRWRAAVAPGSSLKPAYGKSARLKFTLQPSFADIPLPWAQGRLQYSDDGKTWKDAHEAHSTSGVFYCTEKTIALRRYRLTWSGDGVYAASTSPALIVKPKVSLGTPVAPKTMKKGRYYSVYGSLKPRHAKGTKPVRVYKYKKVDGKWKPKGYVKAKAYNYKGYTRYKLKMRLTSKGKWRLRAYAPADSKHAATWSKKYDYVTVK